MNVKAIGPLWVTVLAVAATMPMAYAQDPAKVGPDIYKCTFENEHTRVCEVTFAPGAKIASHSHPQHLVYVLEAGKIRITDDTTGKGEDHDFAVGQTAWMPAVTHHGENVGTTQLKALIIEFKDLPKAEATK